VYGRKVRRIKIMDAAKGLLSDAKWLVKDLGREIDRFVPKLLIFWVGVVSALVFFLPELVGLKK
jgi:hypothetical protein